VTKSDWAMEMVAGTEVPELVPEPLTLDDYLAYQDVCNNRHPVHYDTEYTQAVGLPGPFAPGMLTAGILANYVANAFGVHSVRRFQVQFRDRSFIGDVLTYRAKIASMLIRDGEQVAELELFVTRQTGTTHIQGSATVVLPDPRGGV
jgi:acyl dehydratase